MSTITVNSLLERVNQRLIDPGWVRWPRQELLDYLNDAVRAIVLRRPDASTSYQTFTCVAGTRQTLPPEAVRLIEVVRNVGSSAVRFVPRATLDESYPDWQKGQSARRAAGYVYDERDPKTFWLYPGVRSGVEVELIVSVTPGMVTLAQVDSMVTLPLDDVYFNPIYDFILFRAHSKDAEHDANAQLANSHFQAFGLALGEKMQTDSALAQAKKPGYTGA